MNQAIYKKIKALPSLDDTVVKIQRICTDENSNLNQLVKAVEQDPMLTANILRAANSPLYGFSREIQNISRAVSLFGMATVRGFALSSVLRKNISIDLSPYSLTNAQFQDISAAQSALMIHWYGKINSKMNDVLVPAAFMMEIGKIIIANELIETKQNIEFATKIKECNNSREISELELNMLGVTNEEVTARIFEEWNLETEMVDSIHYSFAPADAPTHIRPYAIALQIVKSAVNVFGILDEARIESTLPLLDENGLEQSIFLEAVDKVK